MLYRQYIGQVSKLHLLHACLGFAALSHVRPMDFRLLPYSIAMSTLEFPIRPPGIANAARAASCMSFQSCERELASALLSRPAPSKVVSYRHAWWLSPARLFATQPHRTNNKSRSRDASSTGRAFTFSAILETPTTSHCDFIPVKDRSEWQCWCLQIWAALQDAMQHKVFVSGVLISTVVYKADARLHGPALTDHSQRTSPVIGKTAIRCGPTSSATSQRPGSLKQRGSAAFYQLWAAASQRPNRVKRDYQNMQTRKQRSRIECKAIRARYQRPAQTSHTDVEGAIIASHSLL